MKTNVDRIRYYTRKANEYSARSFDYTRRRTDRKPPANRFQRLMTYKGALANRLKREGDELNYVLVVFSDAGERKCAKR
jgi:hypothetical protein